MYIERRRRRYYALHDIPESLQPVIGKKRFVQSLGTFDRATAAARAALLEARWRAEIEQVRRGAADPIELDAAFWRRMLDETPEPQREIVHGLIVDRAREAVDRAAVRVGIEDDSDPRYDDLPEMEEAQRFIGLATGTLVRLETHLDAYIKTLEPTPKRRGLKPRTIFQRRSTLEKFFVRFPYAQDVTRKAVQKWIDEMDAAGFAPDSIKKTVGEVRSFWEYLQQQEVISDEDSTFDKIKRPTGKNDAEERRLPFTPEDVVALHRQAVANGDPVLADLIFLGAYTGARVESLCVLKDSDVNTSDWSFKILSDKTKAGRRVVPIHTELRPVIRRLIGATKDGYLLPGLKEDKWGDRSSNIRARFGALKTAMGFGEQHVFHSLRKTVSTFFDQNNVNESVAADIVGHKKKTMTYGVYSGGTSLEQRHQAIEVIRYPW